MGEFSRFYGSWKISDLWNRLFLSLCFNPCFSHKLRVFMNFIYIFFQSLKKSFLSSINFLVKNVTSKCHFWNISLIFKMSIRNIHRLGSSNWNHSKANHFAFPYNLHRGTMRDTRRYLAHSGPNKTGLLNLSSAIERSWLPSMWYWPWLINRLNFQNQ